jgi:hypothetical protein
MAKKRKGLAARAAAAEKAIVGLFTGKKKKAKKASKKSKKRVAKKAASPTKKKAKRKAASKKVKKSTKVAKKSKRPRRVATAVSTTEQLIPVGEPNAAVPTETL